jgi:hypothetical protein
MQKKIKFKNVINDWWLKWQNINHNI